LLELAVEMTALNSRSLSELIGQPAESGETIRYLIFK
jgi:hypothetical protein